MSKVKSENIYNLLIIKPYYSPQKLEHLEPVKSISNLIAPGKSLDNIGGGGVGAVLEIAGTPSIFVHLDKGYTWMLTWMHILKPFGFARIPGCP